ncbi:MAG TPA: membrane protein insertion efficiency factor YidD [Pilimelia sp.]|nr:membrane protein insertion efficiency factor YidD [Pilimelia sp.]
MAAIRGYRRWLSPRLPTRCRHRPTCSGYGLEAVRRYGLVTGARLTAGRIRRCTAEVPRGTADPVP